MAERLAAPAPAKVNLALDVLGRRTDGYHELDTLFLELELADRVELVPADAPGLEVSGPHATDVPAGPGNLAWRALELAAAAAGVVPRYTLRIDKQIPAAGGLAGGSSDAGAVLRLAARLWPESAPKLPALALELGSDVPFFLLGGFARGRGRGELLEPLPPLCAHDVVLFLPPAGTEAVERKTAAVFAELAELDPRPPAVSSVLERVRGGSLSTEDLLGANALERAALAVFPWLEEHRARIEAAIGSPVVLTGAGPTWFWIGPAGSGRAVAQRARQAGLEVIETRTAAR